MFSQKISLMTLMLLSMICTFAMALTGCTGGFGGGFAPATLSSTDGSAGSSLPGSTPQPSGSAKATSLKFVTQPGGAGEAVGWPTQPTIQVYDQYGKAISSNANVVVKIGVNPSGGQLRGADVRLQADHGVATFSDLSINRAGTGYTLIASSPGLASATSTAFNINVNAGTTYYVSLTGSDSNSGTSATSPWQTVAKVNASSFNAGDTVLFQAGQPFSGCLSITSKIHSTPAQPFTIGAYGSGRFQLNANCTKTETTYDITHNQAAVHVGGITGFVLQDCVLVGNSNATTPPTYGAAYGVLFDNGGYQSGLITSSVTVQRCDMSGFTTGYAGDFGGDIFMNTQGPTTHISFLDNTLHGANGVNSVEDNGIGGSGNAEKDRLKDVVVQGNHIFNIGGHADGPGGCLGNGVVLAGANLLIENNVAHDNGANINTCGGSANFWAVSADHAVIQFNESYRNAPRDPTLAAGGPNANGCDWDGFDLDLNVTNSFVQFNYSHENFGSGLLAFVSTPPWGPNTFRYNVSIADGNPVTNGSAFGIGNWGRDAGKLNVYNNVFDTVQNGALGIFAGTGPSLTGVFANNIFRIGTYGSLSKFIDNNATDSSGLTFMRNAYWAASVDPAASYYKWGSCGSSGTCYGLSNWQSFSHEDPLAIAYYGATNGTPRLTLPASAPTCSVSAITSATDGAALIACIGNSYKLQSSSPLLGTGIDLTGAPYLLDVGPTDFFGNVLSSNSSGTKFNLGAYGGN
jgi:hypothetical protein